MGQGRGSAMAVAAVALLGLLLLHSPVVEAATFVVGGGGGWTFGVSSWTNGKRFRAGDTLVFNYDPKVHNVISFNKAMPDLCKIPPGAKVFRSGMDRLNLVKGPNFFICGVPGHCQAGMKIAVFAM